MDVSDLRGSRSQRPGSAFPETAYGDGQCPCLMSLTRRSNVPCVPSWKVCNLTDAILPWFRAKDKTLKFIKRWGLYGRSVPIRQCERDYDSGKGTAYQTRAHSFFAFPSFSVSPQPDAAKNDQKHTAVRRERLSRSEGFFRVRCNCSRFILCYRAARRVDRM